MSLSLLPVIAIATMASPPSFRAITFGFGPREVVNVSDPEIVWQIHAESGVQPSSWKMALNDKQVPAKYDAQYRSLVYVPREPLAPGSYEVKAQVTFQSRYAFKREWSFKVADRQFRDVLPPNPHQQQALEAVNRIRKRLGLEEARMNDRLNAAADAHAVYMLQNKRIGHDQRSTDPGFFGATAQARLSAYGWSRGHYEDVSMGHETVVESVRGLFDAPYHRIPFLQPGPIQIGSGYRDTYFAMLFATTSMVGTTVSPGDGEEGVPLMWDSKESPDPRAPHGLGVKLGYPIVLADFDGNGESIRIVSALVTAGGQVVPTAVNDSSNDRILTNAIIILPRSPLKPNTVYRLQVEAVSATGRQIAKEWQF